MSRSTKTTKEGKSQIIDFSQARAQKLEEKRRTTERIIFKQMLGIYSVIGAEQPKPIEIVDVSEEGLSFQVPHNSGDSWLEGIKELPIRLYFSQDTYMQVHVKIQNSRPSIEDGVRYTRFGCTVDKKVTSYEAYQHFVRFLKMYSTHAHKDNGKVTLFYL